MRPLRTFFAGALLMVMVTLVLAMIAMPVMAQNSFRDATGGFLKEKTFLASAARTTDGDSGSPVDAGAYDVGNIIVSVTAASGGGTLTPTFEVCADSGTTKCVSHTAGTGITTTGNYVIKVNQFARYVRVSYTITGGSSPSFTFSVYGAFKPTT